MTAFKSALVGVVRLTKIDQAVEKVRELFVKETEDFMASVGQKVRDDIEHNMRLPKSGPIMTRWGRSGDGDTFTRRTWKSSNPGEYPAIASGNLLGGVRGLKYRVNITGKFNLTLVGDYSALRAVQGEDGFPYADVLERGSRKAAARPYLKPSEAKVKQYVKDALKERFRRLFK